MSVITTDAEVDVIVVGSGNAGFTAAHAAAERGRVVTLLEKASAAEAGGNSYYTAGATRIAHGGLDDLIDLVEADDRHALTEVPPYSEADYIADLEKVTGNRNDPALTAALVSEAHDGVRWLKSLGLRYRLMYERQAYQRTDGSYLFWGGLHIGNVGGGEGMIADHMAVARRKNVEMRFGHAVTELLTENGSVVGVRFRRSDGTHGILRSSTVILASGGFEANPEMREEHLGPGWSRAKTRGTPHNTGELLLAALQIGAAPGGDWSTCHSTAWDAWAKDNESNRELTNRLTRQSYPLGIVVNAEGLRFIDEGADFRNYTYAKYGREILAQTEATAFQLFDATTHPLLRREEYEMPGISMVVAENLSDLAVRLGVHAETLLQTVANFNASIDDTNPFDPSIKDGRVARTTPPKSNWSQALRTPPYYGFPVTCGITFTFGGLKGDDNGRVLDTSGTPIPGLFACGEALGGLFSGNYPGGSGLAAGVVFGRRAGLLA